MRPAQLALDVRAQVAPRALETARYRRLMLAHRARDLAQRQLVAIIVAEAEAILALESGDRRAQRRREDFHHARMTGLAIINDGCIRLMRLGIVQRLETPRAAHIIDVALGDDRAQPRRERAAPVKIVKQRAALRALRIDAVQ